MELTFTLSFGSLSKYRISVSNSSVFHFTDLFEPLSLLFPFEAKQDFSGADGCTLAGARDDSGTAAVFGVGATSDCELQPTEDERGSELELGADDGAGCGDDWSLKLLLGWGWSSALVTESELEVVAVDGAR